MMTTSSPSAEPPTLGLLVNDVSRLLRRRFERHARAAKLPINRNLATVLVYVSRDEGLSQATLAQLLDIEPINLVRLVDRLEGMGLIERRLNPRDRRVWALYLTPAARPMLEQIQQLGQKVREEAFAGVPEEIRDALIGGLFQIKRNLCANAPAESEEEDDAAITASAAHG